MDNHKHPVYITDRNIPIFIISVFFVIFFQSVRICENIQSRFKTNAVFSFILGFIIAPIIYYKGRNNNSFSSRHALQAFLWETALVVIMAIIGWSAYFNSTGNMLKDFNNQTLEIIMGVAILIMFVNVIFAIYASCKAIRGKEYSHPLYAKSYDKKQITGIIYQPTLQLGVSNIKLPYSVMVK